MPEVTLRRVPLAEKNVFSGYFQDYLDELSRLNGARRNRQGQFEYRLYDRYWEDETFMPFFVERRAERVGLVLLRELPAHESPTGDRALQVAEIHTFCPHRRRGVARQTMRLAAQIAEDRRMPLTWSAYMNNGPAVALYRQVLREYEEKDGTWITRCTRGIDRSGLARFYYQMHPAAASRTEET